MPRDAHGVPEFQDPRFLLFVKMEFPSIVISPLSLGFTKFSVVCFDRRIFRGNIFSNLTMTLLAAIASWGIAFFFAGLFICAPVEAFWTHAPGSECFNPIPLFYTGAISDTVMDVIIWAIPPPLIWQLNLSRRRKIALSAIFSLGIFVLGISASRIALFVEAGRNLDSPDTDMTHDTSLAMYWSQLECSIAVIYAYLPTLRGCLCRRLGCRVSGSSPASSRCEARLIRQVPGGADPSRACRGLTSTRWEICSGAVVGRLKAGE
ncbi:hypothetical protein B0H66DRAFT_593342 [Apodospora peruviana]|uniref:Rhodopsin domain-containing protein n=1 Tax=Apodospora peruviana TaxID=516989 RepID=A0AAE0HXB8_9PEZI|nr:hypothetical protein B0H66DRAFT_593342 [Apodospora peruviana]